jgi:hypothetical protein
VLSSDVDHTDGSRSVPSSNVDNTGSSSSVLSSDVGNTGGSSSVLSSDSAIPAVQTGRRRLMPGSRRRCAKRAAA